MGEEKGRRKERKGEEERERERDRGREKERVKNLCLMSHGPLARRQLLPSDKIQRCRQRVPHLGQKKWPLT